jgi:SSS family solute:Na+ symporter
VTLFAGGIIVQELTGLSLWTSAVIIVLATGLYTVAGGLRAVIYTEVVQTFILIVGSVILTLIGLSAVGGWSGLQERVPDGFFSMWRPIDDPQFPWTGIVFGAPILGIWYWCTDQVIVQRVLAARSIAEARAGTIFAAYLKILPVFIFVLPGVIAAALYEDVRAGSTDQAFPALVTRLLPTGMKGLVVAGLLAAVMSSLASIFNSCSTLVTWDVYRKLNPDASERRLVTVGRVATSVMVVLGLLWIPFMKYISSQLYIYLQSVQAYIAPPIAACFLLGVFMPRLNGAGAITALLTGFVLGALRLVLELINGPQATGLPDGTLWSWIAEINFLHYAVLLFVLCSILLVGVSLLTAPPERERIRDITFQAAPTPAVATARERQTVNVALSIGLAVVLGVLWTVFA